MIKISDKVICIDDKPGDGTLEGYYTFPNGYLKINNIYVIEKIEIFDWFEGSALSFYLVGTKAFDMFGTEIPFDSRRFRKLEDVKMENELKRLKGQSVEI